jgi:hypothetical protein
MKNETRIFLLVLITGLVAWNIVLQVRLSKAQSRIAMANEVIEMANSAPTNTTGVLIYVSRHN